MFANGLRDQGSIPAWVTLKTQNMVLDASLLNTQNYMVWIKSKSSNPGKELHPSVHLDELEREPSRSTPSTVGQLTTYISGKNWKSDSMEMYRDEKHEVFTGGFYL